MWFSLNFSGVIPNMWLFSVHFIVVIRLCVSSSMPFIIFECFPSSDRIMFIDKYAFIEECLEGAVIFRIKDLIHTICVTKPFVDRVKEAGLTGFDFRLLTE